MKQLLLASLFSVFLVQTAAAQNESSAFTATGRGGAATAFVRDYQSIGINPANLGMKHERKITFGFGELGAGLGSQSLNRSQLSKFITAIEDPITAAERTDIVSAFSQKNALNLNADLTTFGIGVHLGKAGGFAFSNRQRVVANIGLNQNFAEVLFLGRNASIYRDPTYRDRIQNNEPLLSKAFDGSNLQIAWLNEWNVAYGKQVLDSDELKLSVGAGYRYVQGIGALDVSVVDGVFTGYSALSGVFNVDYGDRLTRDPDFNYVPEKGSFPFFKAAGTGHGFDVGVSAEIKEKLRLSLSVTDLGNMKWKNNLLQAEDQPLQAINSEGIETYNIFGESADIVGSDGLLTYKSGGERTVSLPTRLRFGAGYMASDKLEIGADFSLPFNKVAANLPAPFVGLGVGYKPAKAVHLNTGLSAGAGYGLNIPLGVVFDLGVYEIGFGTRSVNGWFSQTNPYSSVAFGMLRFKFGKMEEE